MNDWLQTIDPNALLIGLLAGVLIAVVAGLLAWRTGARRGREAADIEMAAVREELAQAGERLEAAHAEARALDASLDEAKRELAVVRARMEEQQAHFDRERANLESAEKRLGEQFERLAGRVFEERTKTFSELSEKQLGTLLKPLVKDLETFRGRVEATHKEEIAQHRELKVHLDQLKNLNERINDEARNLTRALTTQVKSQGAWGEQQLEKLLELSGLTKGEHYHTQVSVLGADGNRLQPDFVLRLPEGRSIVMDSKVSLTAWTRSQAAATDDERERELADHVKSLRAHIDGLSAKNYPGAEELNALDFVLMFVPVESALIAALQRDPNLPEYALDKRVALLSPSNFLATVRTVASVWMVHKQNTNARDIASRAGALYDKFVGFTENLRQVGDRLRQAGDAYQGALGQLSTGPGNLVRQAEMLKDLGAKHRKQLDEGLLERSDRRGLELVKSDAIDAAASKDGMDSGESGDDEADGDSGGGSSGGDSSRADER